MTEEDLDEKENKCGMGLAHRKSGNNFNAAMCKAAKVSIAEVEELVEVGQMDPNDVDVPHIYVHRVVHCPAGEKRIEVHAHVLPVI